MTEAEINQAFLSLVSGFPAWMDTRKRPHTSVSGKYLRAIIEEEEKVYEALTDFEKSFFMLTYVGRESEILDYAYVTNIGTVDIDYVATNIDAEITTDPRVFMNDRDNYILYQDGSLVVCEQNVPEDKKLVYEYDGYSYGLVLVRTHIWNIFDEFAMFLALERHEDETNSSLLKRCFLAFQRPTNSTAQGLKNAIANEMASLSPIEPDEITIERPNETNLFFVDDKYETLYERLAQFNRDMFRTKTWDADTWEHTFKTLGYLPVPWDKEIDTFQDGTGQRDDLETEILSANENETTDVEITGYVKSAVEINECVRKRNIAKEIPLTLTRFSDELIAKTVQYRITAVPATKIDPYAISLHAVQEVDGETVCNLSDIVTDPGDLTIVQRNRLEAGKRYRLEFFPAGDYASMDIRKADFAVSGTSASTVSLLSETDYFKLSNDGVLKSVDVHAHVTNLDGVKTFSNMANKANGFAIGKEKASGSFSVDVTGMSGKPLAIGKTCPLADITTDASFVSCTDFTALNDAVLISGSDENGSSIEIDLECNRLSFRIGASDDPMKQGSCIVTVTVDGEVDTKNSGLKSQAWSYDETYGDTMHAIHVSIRRVGSYPVVVESISVSRYSMTFTTDKGDCLHTAFADILPRISENESNVLHVQLENYGTSPTINYVHIGAALGNISYRTEIFETPEDGESSLDISTDCVVFLYEETDDGEILLSDNYKTNPVYRNDTEDSLAASISVDEFSKIVSSSIPIQTTAKNGIAVSFIEIAPGQSIESITIVGSSRSVRGKKTIAELICEEPSDTVYVSSNANGFIVKKENGFEKIVWISQSEIGSGYNSIVYNGLPSGIVGQFVIDKANDLSLSADEISGNFEYTYLLSASPDNHVAYNQARMLQPVVSGIKIVNTFSPALNFVNLMLYQIDAIQGAENGTALFEKTVGTETFYESWSLGVKPGGIRIECSFNYENEESYLSETHQVYETFAVSNSIALDSSCVIDGTEHELAEYIVTPPSEFRISYGSMACSETIVAEEDGFNKLHYSNVSEILGIKTEDGVNVTSSSWSLLPEAGILAWEDNSYAGEAVTVAYSYKTPKAITYKSLDYLYAMVGYSMDAYRMLDESPIYLKGLSDGESMKFSFEEEAVDLVIAHATNSNFAVSVSDGIITAKLLSSEPTIVTRGGYYYDAGDEFYFFVHHYVKETGRASNVELENVKRSAGALEFMRNSNNHVKDSAFTNSNREEVLCEADFIDGKSNLADGISCLCSITACDAYELWNAFRMDVSFAQGKNGMALRFEADDDSSYAILDISKAAKKGMLLSFFVSGNIKASIMREVLAGTDSMRKSIYAEPIVALSSDDDGICSYIFDENTNESLRYYLMIKGTGIVDDIVAIQSEGVNDKSNLHRKNLDILGFSVSETVVKETEAPLFFDPTGNFYDGLELAEDGTISTGSSVDWGVTLLYSSKGNMEDLALVNATLIKGGVYSDQGATAKVVLPKILLSNVSSILRLYIKINDILIDSMEFFGIHVSTGSTREGNFREIASASKENLLGIPGQSLLDYVQVSIDMQKGKVINSIEIYARHAESDAASPHITRNPYGVLRTKIYDTVTVANWRPCRIEGIGNNIGHVGFRARACRYNGTREQWTDWFSYELNESLTFGELGHSFNSYQYFQFEISIDNPNASLLIDKIILKAV